MYEAEIEEIDRENGTAAVTFSGYGNAEVIPLQNLKAAEEGRRIDDDGVKSKSKYGQKCHTFNVLHLDNIFIGSNTVCSLVHTHGKHNCG